MREQAQIRLFKGMWCSMCDVNVCENVINTSNLKYLLDICSFQVNIKFVPPSHK